MVQRLTERIEDRKKDGEPMFFPEFNENKHGYRAGSLQHRIRRLKALDTARKRAKAQGLRIKPNHNWRHRAVSQLASNGISPWLQDYMVGHKRRGMGGRYYTPFEKDLMEATEGLRLPA